MDDRAERGPAAVAAVAGKRHGTASRRDCHGALGRRQTSTPLLDGAERRRRVP